MKKILFTANSMCFGGIEKALVTLLKNINYNEYDVTLILQKKEGEFLSEIPSQVKVIEYRISTSKNIIIRKIYNRLKLIFTSFKLKNKFDFSACFATYSIPSSKLALISSSNNAIWIHNDYYYMFKENIDDINKFFNSISVDKFKRIIFVANESKDNFLKLYPHLNNKLRVCNNLIDYKKIINMSNESIDEKTDKKIFLNVSRHDETQKRLKRLINATKILLKKRCDFEVWMVGSGNDTDIYRKMIYDNKLDSYIKLIGPKKNPYPYYKKACAFILTSDYEGFPIVYVESCIFKLPIITTIDVSDDYLDIKKYGVLVDMDEESISDAMDKFLNGEFEYSNDFSPEKYNEIILNKINNYFCDKD